MVEGEMVGARVEGLAEGEMVEGEMVGAIVVGSAVGVEEGALFVIRQ